MIKILTIILCLISGTAWGLPPISGWVGKPASGGPAADCSDTFTISGGDDTDITTDTIIEAESDPGASSGLIVYDTDDVLRYSIDAVDDDGYGIIGDTDVDCALNNQTEITIKGKMRFSAVTDVSSGASTQYLLSLYKTDGATASAHMYISCSSGDIDALYVKIVNDALGSSTDFEVFSPSANTWYPFTFYFKSADSAGIVFADVDLATNPEVNAIDNDTHQIDEFRVFGPTLWGTGAAGTVNVDLDDIQIFKSDAR